MVLTRNFVVPVCGRIKNADVLEWIWFLNSHQSWQYRYQHGDKDTYRIAFELSRKLDRFQQVVLMMH